MIGRYGVVRAWVVGWLLALPLMAAAPDPRRDLVVDVVEQVMPCVVNIATEEIVEYRDPYADLFSEFWGRHYRSRPRETRYSLGSGVIIDEEGYVLTNLHVVQRATKVWVQLADGREFEAKPLVGTSRQDVALLRLVAPEGERFKALPFAGDQELLLGETVLALGNPFGLGGSVSRGILSSKDRRPAMENEPMAVANWLQTDAAINPGSSGGPLVNLRGELIGLSVAVHAEGQGIGFAIPVREVTEALSEIYTPEVQASRWFGGRIKPNALGLAVAELHPGGPAEAAGLQVGDRLLEVDAQRPRSFVHCMLLLTGAGEKVKLKIERDGRAQTITVVQRPLHEVLQLRLGLTLQEMDTALAQQFGLRPGQGLLVTDVESGSPAAEAQLEAGHVIATMDGEVTPDLLSAVAVVAKRPKDSKVVLGVLVEQRRGNFVRLRQAPVEIRLR